MPNFTDADLDEFEQIALTASQADWQVGHTQTDTHEAAVVFFAESFSKSDQTDLWSVFFNSDDPVMVGYTGNGSTSEANAVYIAACKPANVLALIRELRRLRKQYTIGGFRHA